MTPDDARRKWAELGQALDLALGGTLELTEAQRQLVVDYARTWPKTLNSTALLQRLHTFAVQILERQQ